MDLVTQISTTVKGNDYVRLFRICLNPQAEVVQLIYQLGGLNTDNEFVPDGLLGMQSHRIPVENFSTYLTDTNDLDLIALLDKVQTEAENLV